VNLPLIRVVGSFPQGLSTDQLVEVGRTNPNFQGQRVKGGKVTLESLGTQAFLQRTVEVDAQWPKVAEIGVSPPPFGFAILHRFSSDEETHLSTNLIIPCDFDSLAQQSLFIQTMVKEGQRPNILERCCGDAIYPRPVVIQLVAFYLSAKTRDRTAHVFVSREGFKEANKDENKALLRLSATDRVFLKKVQEKGMGIGPLLWSELMGIAAFLQIPALERLIRTAVVVDEAKHFCWDD